MDRQPNKKLRLSSGSAKPFNDPYHSSVSTNKYSTTDDDEVWGDDLAVDDDLIQEIETQGYSQYQNNVRILISLCSYLTFNSLLIWITHISEYPKAKSRE